MCSVIEKLVKSKLFRLSIIIVNDQEFTAPLYSRGLRNSEIRFGIGISETEPGRTEQFLEFRKSRNSKKFGIPTFLEFQHLFWTMTCFSHLYITYNLMVTYPRKSGCHMKFRLCEKLRSSTSTKWLRMKMKINPRLCPS